MYRLLKYRKTRENLIKNNYMFINHTILFLHHLKHRFVLKLGRKSLHVDKYTIRNIVTKFLREGVFLCNFDFSSLITKGWCVHSWKIVVDQREKIYFRVAFLAYKSRVQPRNVVHRIILPLNIEPLVVLHSLKTQERSWPRSVLAARIVLL